MSLKIGLYINQELLKVLPTTSINPILQPENTDNINTYIVYKRVSLEPDYTDDGLAFNKTVEEVNIFSKNYTDCVDIAQTVRDTFELKIGTYGNNVKIYQCTLLQVGEETTDGNIYVQTLQFEFLTN